MTDTENAFALNKVKIEKLVKPADNKNGGNWGAECYVLDEFVIKVRNHCYNNDKFYVKVIGISIIKTFQREHVKELLFDCMMSYF